ncbi:LysR family transcriptional regulator [Streptomyces scopuliridis]|uniref:LysR family transcriptional regulator n=1 Tax=Streptomyces scopuliridis TaxID=452529 RepID=UPI00369CEA29
MDVRSLRYALTLADELHFGRAASVHYIAAQPFGRRIQELERELGTKLFERTSRRVTLTPAGERLLPRARRVLADLDALMQAVEGDRTEPVLRIGVLGFGLADRWPATRALLARHHPALELVYVELDWANQYDAVRTGDVDVAILHDVGGAEDLLLERVMDTERCVVVPADADLAEAGHLTASDVSDRPWVTPVGQPGLADWSGDRSIRGDVEVRSPVNIPAAVATTGLLGIHAEPATRFLSHPGVRYLPIDGPRAVVAIASRLRDQREPVAAFRAAAQAGAVMDQLDHNASSFAT